VQCRLRSYETLGWYGRDYRIAALRARAARAVDTGEARRRDVLRGRPPSIPFLRDDSAFRFDRTEPRHAGQNETRSIL
jgi:hypothetical protein